MRDAGLVLLHPFLSTLFRSVDLHQPGASRLAPASLPKAAALLHWLVSGLDAPLEFELGFVRVLLGLRPETPLVVGAGSLGSGEIGGAEAMLEAALGHWGALGGTTVAGLRATFLQRPGLLDEDEQGWRLRVEERAFDVLGRLPGGSAW